MPSEHYFLVYIMVIQVICRNQVPKLALSQIKFSLLNPKILR